MGEPVWDAKKIVVVYKWVGFKIDKTFCKTPALEVFCVWFDIKNASNLEKNCLTSTEIMVMY